MRLVNRTVGPSPDRPGTVRIAAEFAMERSGAVIAPWFELSEEHADELSSSGNPWLIYMVPMAMAAGEDIVLPLPVDAHLAENLSGLMRLWNAWFPRLRPAAIDAPLVGGAEPAAPRRGLFFSGGLDSLFSLLRHDREAIGCAGGAVDDLIFVAGFDIPLDAEAEIDAAERRLAAVARGHGKQLIRVATNMKMPGTPYLEEWILSHGCALGTIGHLLEGRLGEIVIGSTHSYSRLLPIGSHPMTDPLLSSRRLRVVHDGAAFTRIDKLALVAAHQEALDALRVCWEAKRHDNCCRCNKCLTTMTVLDLLGFRNRAGCFDWSGYTPSSIQSVVLEAESEINQIRDLSASAKARGRGDIEEATRRCLDSAARRRSIVGLVRRTPILWRFDYQVGQLLQTNRPQ